MPVDMFSSAFRVYVWVSFKIRPLSFCKVLNGAKIPPPAPKETFTTCAVLAMLVKLIFAVKLWPGKISGTCNCLPLLVPTGYAGGENWNWKPMQLWIQNSVIADTGWNPVRFMA